MYADSVITAYRDIAGIVCGERSNVTFGKKKPDFEWEMREDEHGNVRPHFWAMFMSDFHLGQEHSRAKRTTQFLQNTTRDNLFAIGDIIDIEAVRKHGLDDFGKWHEQVAALLLRENAHKFVGNHECSASYLTIGKERIHRADWISEQLWGGGKYGKVYEEAVIILPDGRRLKLGHSDQFDRLALGEEMMKKWYGRGDRLYKPITDADLYIQERWGWESVSFAKAGKKVGKDLFNWHTGIPKYMKAAIDADPDADAYMHGHTHMGGFKRAKKKHKKTIYNTGTCAEGVEGLVIDKNGTIIFIRNWRREGNKTVVDFTEENGKRSSKVIGLYVKPVLVNDEVTDFVGEELKSNIAKLAALPEDYGYYISNDDLPPPAPRKPEEIKLKPYSLQGGEPFRESPPAQRQVRELVAA